MAAMRSATGGDEAHGGIQVLAPTCGARPFEASSQTMERTDKMTIATHALSQKDAAVVGQMREALKMVKGTVTGPHARPMFDDIMKEVAPADNIESEKGVVGGVPGLWVRPQSGPGDRAILYLHGGAYVVGSPPSRLQRPGRARHPADRIGWRFSRRRVGRCFRRSRMPTRRRARSSPYRPGPIWRSRAHPC
jgi:hypothetical protein